MRLVRNCRGGEGGNGALAVQQLTYSIPVIFVFKGGGGGKQFSSLRASYVFRLQQKSDLLAF